MPFRQLSRCRAASANFAPSLRAGAGLLAPHGTQHNGTIHQRRRTTQKAVRISPPPEAPWLRKVIISNDANNTTPDELLSNIKPLADSIRAHNSIFSVVILLTKIFANWATADDEFLRTAVERMLSEGNPSHGIGTPGFTDVNILLAVVDRLPSPSKAWTPCSISDENTYGEEQQVGSQASPTYDNGFEGLAYSALGGLWMIRHLAFQESDAAGVPPSRQSGGHLSFIMRPPIWKDKSAGATSIKIPLANTLFSNGQLCTMFISQWRKSHETGSIEKLRQQDFARQSVNIPTNEILYVKSPTASPGIDSSAETMIDFVIKMPLTPLTPLRQVTDSMGNIIRGLEGEPASQELERSVSQYFEENGISPQTAAVWALIIPKKVAEQASGGEILRFAATGEEHTRTMEIVDGSSQEVFSAMPFKLLMQGARLHRVMSGGGGWGKKAGLLSIDPNVDYSTDQPTNTPNSTNILDLDSFVDGSHLVRNIAPPGDYVRFFIAPFANSTPSPNTTQDIAESEDRLDTLDFGVIPSTVDDIADDTVPEKVDEHRPKIEVFPHHFGALSEVGMGFKYRHDGKVFQTRVDVPFARFSYQTPILPPGSSMDDSTTDPKDLQPSRLDGDESQQDREHIIKNTSRLRKMASKKLTHRHFRYFPMEPEENPDKELIEVVRFQGVAQDFTIPKFAGQTRPTAAKQKEWLSGNLITFYKQDAPAPGRSKKKRFRAKQSPLGGSLSGDMSIAVGYPLDARRFSTSAGRLRRAFDPAPTYMAPESLSYQQAYLTCQHPQTTDPHLSQCSSRTFFDPTVAIQNGTALYGIGRSEPLQMLRRTYLSCSLPRRSRARIHIMYHVTGHGKETTSSRKVEQPALNQPVIKFMWHRVPEPTRATNRPPNGVTISRNGHGRNASLETTPVLRKLARVYTRQYDAASTLGVRKIGEGVATSEVNNAEHASVHQIISPAPNVNKLSARPMRTKVQPSGDGLVGDEHVDIASWRGFQLHSKKQRRELARAIQAAKREERQRYRARNPANDSTLRMSRESRNAQGKLIASVPSTYLEQSVSTEPFIKTIELEGPRIRRYSSRDRFPNSISPNALSQEDTPAEEFNSPVRRQGVFVARVRRYGSNPSPVRRYEIEDMWKATRNEVQAERSRRQASKELARAEQPRWIFAEAEQQPGSVITKFYAPTVTKEISSGTDESHQASGMHPHDNPRVAARRLQTLAWLQRKHRLSRNRPVPEVHPTVDTIVRKITPVPQIRKLLEPTRVIRKTKLGLRVRRHIAALHVWKLRAHRRAQASLQIVTRARRRRMLDHERLRQRELCVGLRLLPAKTRDPSPRRTRTYASRSTKQASIVAAQPTRVVSRRTPFQRKGPRFLLGSWRRRARRTVAETQRERARRRLQTSLKFEGRRRARESLDAARVQAGLTRLQRAGGEREVEATRKLPWETEGAGRKAMGPEEVDAVFDELMNFDPERWLKRK